MSYVTEHAKQRGIPVVDGASPLIVTVTNHDVVNALKADSKRCALSRAAERIPGVLHGYFFRSIAYLEYRDRMVRYLLPPSAQKEIVSFDRAQIFAPGIYQLSPPGTYSKRKKNRDRSKELKRAKERRQSEQVSPPRGGRRRERALSQKRAETSPPSFSWTGSSGDPATADFLEKMAEVAQRALDGQGMAAGVGRATKQPASKPRRTLVNRTKYVRDISDPDAAGAVR